MSLLRPLRETTATSIGVARSRLAQMGLRRLAVSWVIQAVILLVVGSLVPGVEVASVTVALVAAAVLGLLNALVRPVLVLLTLPLTVLSVGLVSLLINAAMLVTARAFVPGFEVDSLAAAVAAAILITLFTTVVSVVLASDQDESFYAELTRRLATSDRPRVAGARGLVVIQIDGLAAPILRNAIRVGLTPHMARWVRSGAYRLIEWECTPPSQTPASQAGILHGTNDDIPAFRWYEKEHGRLMVANRPADAAEIERRLSNGRGLLSAGGMSANNLFSGDAPRTLLTMSTIRSPSRALDVDALSLYFLDPAAAIRTVVLTLGEMLKEFREARRQRSVGIEPRVHRGAAFAVLRAASNVLLRDLNITFLMHAMGRGVPVMYVDFVDYDELAHHAGPERLESLTSLAGVDRALASIERAAASAPRDYDIVILSDHGQSQGATFRQRFGYPLEGLVRDLMGSGSTLSIATKGEGWGPVNALLTEVSNRRGVAGRATASALARRRDDGAVDFDRAPVSTAVAGAAPDVVVGPSGNLANVYFLAEPRRMTLEEIESLYPGLVAGLAAHPGIGFVLVRSAALGPLALGPAGVHHLRDGRVDGTDPLVPFGPRTADALRRLDGFAHVGDLLVNSVYDAELGEVAAFEELVGSHGGFGGPQVEPFILAPADLPYDGTPVIGAPAVHQLLVSWAERLGVGPGSGAAEIPPKPGAMPTRTRGIRVIAGLTLLQAVVLTLIAGLALVGSMVEDLVELTPIALVLLLLGVVGLAVGVGLWRRRGWARTAAMAYYALSVLQALAVLGTEGLGAIATLGVGSVLQSFLVFFYLTRPHVAAAFRQNRRPPSETPQ